MEYWEMEKGFMTHRVFGVYETRLWRKWVCMGKTIRWKRYVKIISKQRV